MLKKTLTLALLGALACNCALAETAAASATNKSATGNIVFDGYVTLPGVTVKVITVGDNDINAGLDGKSIEMGVPDVPVSVLKTNGEGGARLFKVVLDGYSVADSGLMTVDFTLRGDVAFTGMTKSIYKNEVPANQGGAQGAGIRLRSFGITQPTSDTVGSTFENGSVLTGNYQSDYEGDFSYYFDAAIVPTDVESLTAGHVKSTVNVTVSYK